MTGAVPESGSTRAAATRLTDVARAAGVSAPLASRVLNGSPGVRAAPETRARIVDAAERLGYVPNVGARNLRASRTGLIGLVVHDLSSPIYVDLLRGARDAALARERFVVLGDIDELLASSDAFDLLVNGRRVDGLIVQGGHERFDVRIDEIARAIPTVVVNTPGEPGRAMLASHVAADESSATRLLTRHLLDLGHTRIGLISGPRESVTSRLRERGVVEALTAAGIELDPRDCVSGAWTAAGGRAGLRTLAGAWSPDDRPSAVIAGNAIIAAGVLGEAAHAGILVPVELSVAAVHDTWLSEHLVPTLTTVSLPLERMGVVAVEELLSAHPARDVTIEDPPPMVRRRESTAPR